MLILEMHWGFLCDFVHGQLLELILCALSLLDIEFELINYSIQILFGSDLLKSPVIIIDFIFWF